MLQRINVVGQNAARLDKINELAKQTNVKLSPPLPPGATADAVERRLQMLTKGLSPQELSHVNAVQQDLIRRGEYDSSRSIVRCSTSGSKCTGVVVGNMNGPAAVSNSR